MQPKIKIVSAFNEAVYLGILEVKKKAMPADWEYDDAMEYYKEALENSNNIHVILCKGKEMMGYLLAVPHNDVALDGEMMEADPEIKGDAERYYIETMEIVPELQKTLLGGRLFFKMLHILLAEAEKRFSINKFSMHARVSAGMSRAVQRYFGDMIKTVRHIENWRYYNGEESTDYIEGTYVKK
jgi:hypothetical protein